MIQTRIADGRGGWEELDHNDPRYWEGPYRYEPYPKALYRQTVAGTEPASRVVKSEQEHRALGSDWKESPADAKDAYQALEADMARADAERRAADQRMSARARDESLQIERSTDEMLPAIPERKRPGRKPKQPLPSV